MATCRFKNEKGQACGMPHGHKLKHGNGLLTQGPSQVWTEEPCPTFCIKASDPFACAMIRVWVVMASSYKDKDGKRQVNQEKVKGALDRLEEFEWYQFQYGTKTPD
jgi:hypothetical protein